jgi:hypothetical protein
MGLGRIRRASSAVGRGASGSRLEVASVGPSPALAGTAAGLMIDRHKGGMPNESVGRWRERATPHARPTPHLTRWVYRRRDGEPRL